MILRELALSADRPIDEIGAVVERQSRVICTLLIEAFANRIRPDNFQKVSIRFGRGASGEDGKVVLGVLLFRHVMRTDDFLRMSGQSRAEFILEFICEALTEVFRLFKLSEAELQTARQYVRDHQFVNRFQGRISIEPNGKRKARVEIDQMLDESRIWMAIRENGKVLQRVQIAVDSPDEFALQKYLGKPSWSAGEITLKVSGAAEIVVPLRSM